MSHRLRLAEESDIGALELLIPLSVRVLHAPFYSREQQEASLGPVFGVDRQLIRDRTYFVALENDVVIGCGGWSKRQSLFGGDCCRPTGPELNPQTDAAKVRAFFIHPNHVRRGIGSAILRACEEAIISAGFRRIELCATLAGESLYAKHGYAVTKRYDVELAGGVKLPVVGMSKSVG
jgi:GNAT superfamily N-acetyltransferase